MEAGAHRASLRCCHVATLADSHEEVEVFGFDHNKDHVLVYGRTLLQDEAYSLLARI